MTIPLALDSELVVASDPDSPDSELLSLRFASVAVYETVASRPTLSPQVQVHLANRISGSLMSYSEKDGKPGERCARAFYATATDPVAVEVAAVHLPTASDSGRGLGAAARLLVGNPACTPRARVAAVWAGVAGNGYYREHFSSELDSYLETLGEGCLPARLAAGLAEDVVVAAGGKTYGLDVRCPVGLFTRKVFAVAAELGSDAAVEAYVTLRPEWEGDDHRLASIASTLV